MLWTSTFPTFSFQRCIKLIFAHRDRGVPVKANPILKDDLTPLIAPSEHYATSLPSVGWGLWEVFAAHWINYLFNGRIVFPLSFTQ